MSVFVLLLAFITAAVASNRGRNPVGWFVLGLIFNAIALVLAALLPDLKQERAQVRGWTEEGQRLREEFKNERLRAEIHRAEADVRLDAHDRLAGVPTRPQELWRDGLAGKLAEAAVPPLPSQTQVPWYYEFDGQARGPESASVLKLRLLRGELHPKTLVWRDGLRDWVAADTQEPLFA